jgi:predicted deacylase
MTESPILCSIDLDAPGKQVGQLQVPRSNNTAGWSNQYVPIISIAGGDGPTAVVLGGVHGDEPAGQVAALNLARRLEPQHVHGRLIVIPTVSMDASRAYTRLWPSGANMNRSFPGSPDGSPDEQLAHFLSTELFPRSEIVVDMHSGGLTTMCLPWSEMHWVDDLEQRRKMVDGMYAWNADWCCVYIDIAGSGLLVGEAERQGKVVVSTELGSGGHVTSEIHRISQDGLENVLRRFGVIEGDPVTRADLGKSEQTLLMATDRDNYVLAPESGLFETFVELGQRVSVGEPVGQMHFLERPDRAPEVIASLTDGIVCCVRGIGTTDQGDNVVVVAREADHSELD